MVSSQLHYTKVNRFMPFLLAEILNFQGSTHQYGVGSFSKLKYEADHTPDEKVRLYLLKRINDLETELETFTI